MFPPLATGKIRIHKNLIMLNIKIHFNINNLIIHNTADEFCQYLSYYQMN